MEREILKLEEQIVAAILSSDVEVLDQLLHDQLVFVNHLGMALSKEQDLTPHITGDLKIAGLVASDHQLQVFGDTCVVVVTKDIKGSYLNQPFENKLKFTRIWKLFNGNWKVIAASSVPLHVA
ncbi:nuclear transport factor 2 family protein [Pedobacter frigoris]|uniref:Nuclear transport factor 2 family protein n=1 Tax=Pedobacter frigoris TaxID=2571272 RepID=A0A4U1CLB2_9SPHI|nr:nuclear transport factor 2 family protein [Pedobacter frigoris]TKC08577.1 nuclear transport factor 2 family protein [Pedobacter frigoris]